MSLWTIQPLVFGTIDVKKDQPDHRVWMLACL